MSQNLKSRNSLDSMHKINELQLVVLREQYEELQNELSKIMPNQKAQNGFNDAHSMNGLNGYHGVNGMNGMSSMNGISMNGLSAANHHIDRNQSHSVSISTEHRLKYRIDASVRKAHRTLAVKKQFVSRYPCVLCIHLNRLQFGSKDSRYVSFKPLLSLSDHGQGGGQRMDRSVNCMFNDNDYSLCSQYLLMSVIVHHGSDSGGHYTTYKRVIDGLSAPLDSASSALRRLEWKCAGDLRSLSHRSRWYHISDEFVNEDGTSLCR